MDKIYIKDLEFIGYHGVFPEENKLGQKFLVSAILKSSTRSAAKNDDIDKTTHYGFVAKTIEKVFFSKNYMLIETLAEDIAEEILKNYVYVSEVTLQIKKPWAPIGLILDYAMIEITRKWNKAYISLGSNMGEKEKNLTEAIAKIEKIENTFVTKKSQFLNTAPYGYTEQDDFVNACIEIKTLASSEELLEKLLEIEKEMGRVRLIKWGPRIIDLDIIFFNNEVLDEENLIVPHPYMHLRTFVLEPMQEIAANYVHPILRKTVTMLLNELKEKE